MSVIQSHRWSVNAACHSAMPFFPSRSCSASGKLSFTLLHLFGSPVLLKLAFISTLQAAPFQSIMPLPTSKRWCSEKGPQEGKHAKRCGIFLSFLAPMVIRHKALCPFLHAFFPMPCWLIASFFWESSCSRLKNCL